MRIGDVLDVGPVLLRAAAATVADTGWSIAYAAVSEDLIAAVAYGLSVTPAAAAPLPSNSSVSFGGAVKL